MRKTLSLLAVVFTLGLSTVAMDAEASKRLGGGKSMGMQRDAPDRTPAATPAQTPATAAAGAAGAAGASSKSKWLGPVAGIAAGIGLVALASHFGFGEELANLLLLGLLALAVLLVVGFVLRKRAAARMGGMQFAPAGMPGGRPAVPPYQVAMPGSSIGANLRPTSKIPADFDSAAFVRNAKINFIRLQAANDAGNLDDIRQFTTPEMFAELQMNLSERGGTSQHTDVVRIDGEVIEVIEESNRYLVSVRFTGETRESGAAGNEAFDEIWHLSRPRQGAGGWVLAGIQQTA